MILITDEDITSRSLEMWNAVNAILDKEIKENAMKYATERIQEMREALIILDDEEFFQNLCEIAEDAWKEEPDLLDKVLKLKNLLK